MAIEEADAGIPAQDGVVVACGAKFFCLLKEIQRFDDPVVDIAAGTGSFGVEVGLGAALPCDSGIVSAVIFRLQLGDCGYSAVKCSGLLRNLVRERENEADACLTVGGIDG